MWLIPLLAGLGGYAVFKSKGGARGIGEKAGKAAVASIKNEAVNEARKVYSVALHAGKKPIDAMKAAAIAVKKAFS